MRHDSDLSKHLWAISIRFIPFCLYTGFGLAQALAPQSVNNTFYASNYPGSDVGARINAADVAASTGAADIWVTEPGTVSTAPTIRSNHRLILAAPLNWSVGPILNSNAQVLGTGQAALQTLNTNSSWITGSNLSNVAVIGAWFFNAYLGATEGSTLLHCRACDGIIMKDNHAVGIGIIQTDTSASSYSEVTAANISQNVLIVDNFMDGQGSQVNLAYLQYVTHVLSANNTALNAQYNVEWWGGNAGVEGLAAANPRWARDINITGGLAQDVHAGFWGSMGQDVTVTGVTVDTCADVGLDAESSSRVIFSGFTVHNCANGGLAVFFASQHNTFGPGTVTSDSASSTLMWAHNSTSDPTLSSGVKIHDVTFVCQDPATPCKLFVDPIGSFVFDNNELTNSLLIFATTNNSGYEVARNRFDFSILGSFNGITIPGQVYNYRKTSNITDNLFQSAPTQPAGTYAIKAAITDYNYPDILYIRGNQTQGFTTDAELIADSANIGISPQFIFEGDQWGNNSVKDLVLGALGTFLIQGQ